jgi:dCMP deaminase
MEPITINPNRIALDEAYMQMAEIWGRRSKANRLQVGALIVKDHQIISDGYNGMPAGDKDDTCEYWVDGELRTKPEVLHAESNALLKITENGGVGAQDGTLYTVYSPCFECSKLIKQAKIKRVVFRHWYRDAAGVEMLQARGVEVEHLQGEAMVQAPIEPVRSSRPPPPPVPPVPKMNLSFIKSMEDRLADLNAAPPMPAREAEPIIPLEAPVKTLAQADAEAAEVLRSFMAQQPGAVPTTPAEKPPGDGPYTSSFL